MLVDGGHHSSNRTNHPKPPHLSTNKHTLNSTPPRAPKVKQVLRAASQQAKPGAQNATNNNEGRVLVRPIGSCQGSGTTSPFLVDARETAAARRRKARSAEGDMPTASMPPTKPEERHHLLQHSALAEILV